MSRACFDCPANKTDCAREHCIPIDGHRRLIQVANRLLPGPSIQVCENDTVAVNVINKLRSGQVTSIHWHGILQKNTVYMDGPSMIVQCPIMEHNSFEYM